MISTWPRAAVYIEIRRVIIRVTIGALGGSAGSESSPSFTSLKFSRLDRQRARTVARSALNSSSRFCSRASRKIVIQNCHALR